MTNKQRKAAELLALGNMTQKEIAAAVGVAEQTVCLWKKSDEFMAEYRMINRQAQQYLAGKARRKLEQLLESPQDGVAYAAARDILDRTGYKAEDVLKIEGTVPVMFVGDDKVED